MTVDLETLFERYLDLALALTGCQHAAILSPGRDGLRLLHTRTKAGVVSCPLAEEVRVDVPRLLQRLDQPILLDNSVFPPVSSVFPGSQVAVAAAVLSEQREALAVFMLGGCGPCPFGPAQLETLGILVDRLTQDINALKTPDPMALEYMYSAYYDQGTGLPNEALVRGTLQNELLKAQREQEAVTLALIGVDPPEHYAATLGTGAARRVVEAIGETLQDHLTTHGLMGRGLLGRLAEGSFAVILPGLGQQEAQTLLGRLLDEALGRGIDVEGTVISVGYGVGLVAYPGEAENAEEMLVSGKLALDWARAAGEDQFLAYAPSLRQRPAQFMRTRRLIREALSEQRIVTLFQPQYCLNTNQLCGFEALMRLEANDKTLIAPADFLPWAEENNMLTPLSLVVLGAIGGSQDRWQQAGHAIPVAINLSGRQLEPGNPLIQAIQTHAHSHPGLADLLEIEVTETSLLQDPAKALETLRHFKSLGLSCSLDDFGTGYSSLGTLRQLPVDKIKLDISFIRHLPESTEDVKVVTAVIDLAHALGLTVVAEGVERPEQLSTLKALGCDMVQGFLLGRPLTEAQATTLVRRGPSPQEAKLLKSLVG